MRFCSHTLINNLVLLQMASSSVDKVLEILLLFRDSNPELTHDEISRQMDIPISTLYRYLRVLSDKGFLEKSSPSTYRLGIRFLELSRVSQQSNRNLRLVALPGMKRIADQIIETVSLMRITDKYAICIESIEGQQVVRVTIEQGRLQPLHVGASSKVLLSALDENDWEHYVSFPLKQVTSASITDFDELKQELYRVRKQGYAISNSEIDEGGRAVAVPIRNKNNKVLAALSVEGPYFRMDDEVLMYYLKLLRHEVALMKPQLT